MSKWRNTCPDVLLTRIEEGYEARLYLLRQTGPSGFLLKEHDSDSKFKVLLGSPHACNCSLFLKERELCIHILWILMKKFRLAKDNPLIFQIGLNERELNDVLYGQKQVEKKVAKASSAGNNRVVEKKKVIESDDVCPICQEDIFNTKKSLIHCKFGCGNSIHINCMKIWADHQLKSSSDEIIKCPLCRTEFSTHQSIVQAYHRARARKKVKLEQQSYNCKHCHLKVYSGQYYRCSICSNFFLCMSCIQTSYHGEHLFEYRKGNKESWRVMIRNDISLTPSITRCDTMGFQNATNKTGDQAVNKNMEKMKTLATTARGNRNSLPDLSNLSLGISGTNLDTHKNNGSNFDDNLINPVFHLPPLAQNTQGVVMTQNSRKKIRSQRLHLRKEHSQPLDGISDLISVSSLSQVRTGSCRNRLEK